MKIRAFEKSDIEQIVTLANRYASFDSDVTEADFQPAWSFPNGLLVAHIENQIIGFVFAYLQEIPSAILTRWASSKVAQIELLVVEPSYRGQRIGKALLERLFEAFKKEGVDLVLLYCPAEAISAKYLYEELGFEVRAFAMKKRL
ncbi:MAG: GNAT family N-acetyltransferase [Candidatus Thorarchaeota archaeon]